MLRKRLHVGLREGPKSLPCRWISNPAAYAPLVVSRRRCGALRIARPRRPIRLSRSAAYPGLNAIAPPAPLLGRVAYRSWARRLQPGTPLAIAGVLLPPKVYPWLPDIASQFPSSAPSANVATIPPGRTDVIRLRKSTSRSTALPVRATSPTRKPSSKRPAPRRLMCSTGNASTRQGATQDSLSRHLPLGASRDTARRSKTTTTRTGLHLSKILSDVLGD